MKSNKELRESFSFPQLMLFTMLKDKIKDTLITHCIKVNIKNQIHFLENMNQIDYSIREVYIDELKEQLEQVKF